MLLDNADDSWIEVAQSRPRIRAGYAQKHIPEELLPIRITAPFLPELVLNGLDFFFAKHRCSNLPRPMPASPS
jgi:hypothetical protein